MFPKRSACYMNLMQCPDDSLKESLKQTMLNQENLFRKQVQDLHRLYQIQVILMKNLRLKEVQMTQSLNYFKKDSRVNWSRYNQKPLDLEVPVSSYVSNFDKHFSNKGKGWGTCEKPVEVEDYFRGETGSSLEEAALSLSIGRDTSQRISGWRTQCEKVHSVVAEDVIELEESTGTVLSRDVKPKSCLCCAFCSVHSRERNCSHSSCSCKNSTNTCSSNRLEKSQALNDESTNILEQNFLNQGEKTWHENLPEVEFAVVEKVFPSHGTACLDLNNPQPDESFLDIKDLKMDYSFAANSSVVVMGEFHKATAPDEVSWTKPNRNCSSQVSALLQHDTPNSALVVCKRTESMNASGSKLCSIDLESYPMSPSNCSEDHGCPRKAAELIPDFSIGNCKDEIVTEVNGKKGDGVLEHPYLCNTGETVEDVVIDERSPTVSKSDHIAQDPSSSLKTMQSGTYLEKSFSRMNSFQNSDSSQVDSSAIGESKSRSSDEENTGSPPHDDPVIQKGAVSLVYFLLEARREHNGIAEVKKTKEEIDKPECSIDSFESIVLKLQESNIDDCCVSSNPYEIDEMDKKDCGIKLRRGRRLKDFQKEILPSLPSLSRQEICEDIRIMEGAIRSREYKRFRSKITTDLNWFTPVKSRRSRLNYIGRRYYK